MKRMAILILCLSLTSTALAGLESSIFATYMDAEDIGTGWGGGLKTELNLWKWLGIDTRLSYVGFDTDNAYMIPLEAALVLNIPIANQRFNPYGGVGIGYYIMNADSADLKDEVGYFPFLGLKAGAKAISFMGEVRWLGLKTSYENAPNNDIKVDGLGVNLGLVFRW
jgi:hypothetical protein